MIWLIVILMLRHYIVMHVYNRYYEQRILGEILTLYFTDFMITYKSDLIFIGKDKAKLSL